MDRLQTLIFGCLLISALVLSGAEARGRGRGKLDEESVREKAKKDGRVLSLFQIVRFPNDPCIGTGSKNGTCYTEAECSSRGGTKQGTCASNYGVCCVFSKTCGQTSSENCTYFESSGSETGACTLNICKCDSNVCQLRLDFNQFIIAGPSTSTITNTKITNGNPSLSGVSVTPHTRCLTDTFSVTSPGSPSPPTICGQNSGEHMYVDAGKPGNCNELVFMLNSATTGATARQWSVKITQYSCDFNNLAPKGCTQYYFGETTNTVQSYNYEGGTHLADQNQQICIRQERGNCRICWTAVADIDVMLSGMTPSMNFAKGSTCCGYGPDGLLTKGYDCVQIPGALLAMTTTKVGPSMLCGRSKGLGSLAAGAVPVTVCSNKQPFSLRFLSDAHEMAMEALKKNIGFRLAYIQSSQNC